MLVVDSSALIAIAVGEEDTPRFAAALASNVALVGTPTLFETRMVLHKRLHGSADPFVDQLVETGALNPEPFTLDMYRAARDAFTRYGKGTGHPAGLNFGDCLSYAVAKVRDLPLLYKGEDFALTDIRAAL